MGELGVLFNPGMRHEREEKLAKQMLREDEGTGRKGRLGIDLESGVVVIDGGSAPSPRQSSGQPSERTGKSADTQTAPDESATGPSEASAASDGASPAPRRTRSATAEHGAAAAPSGKARRRSETSSAAHLPTGKSGRRSR